MKSHFIRSACQKITGFYLVERYPFMIEVDLRPEDVRSSLDEVQTLMERLRLEVNNWARQQETAASEARSDAEQEDGEQERGGETEASV